MELLEGIMGRRSVRRFTPRPVTADELRTILQAGAWAPSGLNNQPWRFVTVRRPETLQALAGCTRYRHVILGAPLCIAVFIDRTAIYHDTKDHQAIGACLENMLLAAHGLGLGGVWLGEILKQADQVRELFALGGELELMAVLAIGEPADSGEERTGRLPLERLLVGEF